MKKQGGQARRESLNDGHLQRCIHTVLIEIGMLPDLAGSTRRRQGGPQDENAYLYTNLLCFVWCQPYRRQAPLLAKLCAKLYGVLATTHAVIVKRLRWSVASGTLIAIHNVTDRTILALI